MTFSYRKASPFNRAVFWVCEVLALLILCLALFVACGGDDDDVQSEEGNHRLYVQYVHVEGTDVPCVIYSHGAAEEGGVSCDFEKLHATTTTVDPFEGGTSGGR